MPSHTYAGPILLTVAYIGLYYGSIVHVARTKFRLGAAYQARGEKFDRYDGKDREMLAADRQQLNTLEHMPPFLVLLWLNAVLVGTTWATAVGAAYLASRLLYPFVMGPKLGRSVRAPILLATVPGYLVMLAFCVALVRTALGY